jgi:hypothetical protein
MSSQALRLAAASVLLCVACSNKTPPPAVPVAATPVPAPATETYTGEIMDAACAAMGSHEAMEQAEGGAKNGRDCTLKCVAGGSKFVLYDAATRTVYQLDDQTKPKNFAGQKVKLTGTLDIATKMIHVQGIEGA